jgi:hypothetical protein
MKLIKNKYVMSVIIVLLFVSNTIIFGINLFRSFDKLNWYNLGRAQYDYYDYNLGFFVETGIGNTKAWSDCGSTNVLQLFCCQQNSLAMLNGLQGSSSVDQLITKINALPNGNRGLLRPFGEVKYEFNFSTKFRWQFAQDFYLMLSLPFYGMELKDVVWNDLTDGNEPEDDRIRECLTSKILKVTKEIGDLDIGPWKRRGLGDMALLIRWIRHFPQNKPMLRNVRVDWHTGFLLPTGKAEDPDKIFAFSFGIDKSVAIPFGLGIELNLGDYFFWGVDVSLFHQFGNTRTRRIKTDIDQTNLLLMQKARVYKNFGLSQQFSLYFGVQDLPRGLEMHVGYKYFKKGSDSLSVSGVTCSDIIANTALDLQSSTIHEMIVHATYDFGALMSDDHRARPFLGVFSRIPFNGTRSVAATTVGVLLHLDF